MQGQSDDLQQQSRQREEWRDAIEQLQQQRTQILQQMEESRQHEETQEQEERQDKEETQTQEHETRRQEVERVTSETQYSIGGVVTLEPLAASQRPVSSGVEFRTAPVDLDPRMNFRNTDALNDVFSLQVKFAETMLKLEKSVQMRDHLLHRGGTFVPKRRTARTELESEQTRRSEGRPLRHRRRSFEILANTDSSVIQRESVSSESFSSSAYSFSSLDSTPQRGQTIRVRYPNFGVSRATTAETLAPSSSGADNSPEREVGDAPPTPLLATTTVPEESPNTQNERTQGRQDSGVATESSEVHQEENHRTPTTGSSVTTPTTGSDQKSNTSSSKQVRFGDDAYSTPVLARKFNFDGPSIDEDECEEQGDESESILSFLGGSSVTSAELNDASFLRAFERFRRELNVSRSSSTVQSPSIARKLFPAQNTASPLSSPSEAVKAEVQDTLESSLPPHTASDPDDQNTMTAFPELEGLSVAELQERRRRLCLDIQAETAQLVLNIGLTHSKRARIQEAEHTKDRLPTLREELKAIDRQLSKIQ
ncbi:unnamed protein product [Phytophthora lilii]|uniref:Unnamed protein product n=1 Tax=Phytophthora lilii TaxID=2077276 RepID=A0A9W6WNL8_9STRA|nr:unnamed protein product [Phytophthora lilii]